MSAQLKAAYDDLVTYLGKDAKGKEKAKRLKDAANELRKKLAAAEEKLEQMEAVKDAARERADVAEDANSALRIENCSLHQKLVTAATAACTSTRVMAAQRQKLMPCTTIPSFRRLDEILKRVCLTIPQCPRPLHIRMDLAASVLQYDRNSLTSEWSDESLWAIGATVSLATWVHQDVYIAAATPVFTDQTDTTSTNVSADFIFRMMNWFHASALGAGVGITELMEKHMARRFAN